MTQDKGISVVLIEQEALNNSAVFGVKVLPVNVRTCFVVVKFKIKLQLNFYLISKQKTDTKHKKQKQKEKELFEPITYAIAKQYLSTSILQN